MPEYVFEAHDIHRDFHIQMDRQGRRPDQVLIYKERTWHLIDFAVPEDHRVIRKENIRKYLDLARGLKKSCDTNCCCYIWKRGLEKFEIRGRTKSHPDNSIFEISKITYKD